MIGSHNHICYCKVDPVENKGSDVIRIHEELPDWIASDVLIGDRLCVEQAPVHHYANDVHGTAYLEKEVVPC